MTRLLLPLALAAIALPSAAQPLLKNAQVSDRTVSGSLESTVAAVAAESPDPSWVAWETPALPRQRGEHWCWSEGTVIRSNRLEPADSLFVFLRLEARRIERVRSFDDGCPIDAGDRPVIVLRGVTPAQSVAFLAGLAEGTHALAAGTRASKGALAALSQHAGPDPVQPLLRLARRSPDTKLRGEALFWLSQRAGREAAAAITDAIANDPATEVKKKAVFALSQLPPDEGVPKLIEVARTHGNPAVRKQAMFWLGQSKDDRALRFFEEVLK